MLKNNELKFPNITENITEFNRLEQVIARLEQEIKFLKDDIFNIEHSEAYLTIKELTNWDEYFEKIKLKLSADLQKLKQEYESK